MMMSALSAPRSGAPFAAMSSAFSEGGVRTFLAKLFPPESTAGRYVGRIVPPAVARRNPRARGLVQTPTVVDTSAGANPTEGDRDMRKLILAALPTVLFALLAFGLADRGALRRKRACSPI